MRARKLTDAGLVGREALGSGPALAPAPAEKRA
jgi:hypothetical protein